MNRITTIQAAALLGVSRRTVWRWQHEGRLPWTLTTDIVTLGLTKRPRGPKASPYSLRYTVGRHTFRGTNANTT